MAELILSKTYRQFKDGCAGKYGMWRSDEMVAASRAFKAWEELNRSPSPDRIGLMTAKGQLLSAWYTWCQKKEFRSVNLRTNNMCKRLAIEMGVLPNEVLERNSTAFVMKGKRRLNPTCRASPETTVTDQTVPAYMEAACRRGERVGLMLVDAFGTSEALSTNGFGAQYGTERTSVLENILATLDVARECHVPIFNVTMNMKFPIKTISDHFPPRWITLNKPKQGVFDGTTFDQDIESRGVSQMIVCGWDANQCVATAIFGTTRSDGSSVKGLLDFGWDVVTSRTMLASNGRHLEPELGWPFIG